MPTKRMLVDATHPEETRIVVTSGNKLEEFDFESAERRQLRGNIYLAKVTRVEPSLQAAFVEYGGNRHGFLAFSEIHPDYYQIPVADREALLKAEEEAEEEEAALDDAEADGGDDDHHDDDDNGENGDNGDSSHDLDAPNAARPKVVQIGEGDALEDIQERPRRSQRKYKIQEVIRRRQVLLVQVVKEERGNKGAALTTYLSLAGRYSVLMPNTARGGGISRKITSAADRKRLKEIASDLEVPQGMGVILRTAGAARTKAEVKRDFEYLMRLWENVRTLTLESTAPCLVYEEGSLIKRTIRDLYNKDISEVLVAGEAAYREAKDFMRMIMPSHSKNVQIYKDDAPIFSRFNIETQLDSMFHPQVTLPSGGYIVINPTEALVSIDVNSGRATREHNIEDTALQTNLEAAEEISRQLRLRDLAGLIVIDFIDMEERRNNRAVEKKLKDCLKNDRARIQVGHISHFGLLEMSRQRIRFGVLESSTHSCPTCAGTGLVRSVSSVALMVMRAIEDHVLRKPGQSINANMPAEVALYILNTKRETLLALEAKYGLSITISALSDLVGSQFNIERGEARTPVSAAAVQHIRADSATMSDYDEAEGEAESEGEETADADSHVQRDGKRRRRRRRGRGGNGNGDSNGNGNGTDAVSPEEAATPDAESGDTEEGTAPLAASEDDDDHPRKRRRRGRRGGRRNRRGQDGMETDNGEEEGSAEAEAMDAVEGRTAEPAPVEDDTPPADAAPVTEAEEQPVKKPRRTRKPAAAKEVEAETASEPVSEEPAPVAEEPAPEAPEEPVKKPRAPRRRVTKKAEAEAPAEEAASEPAAEEPAPKAESKAPARARKKLVPADEIVTSSTSTGEEEKPKKAGWWQRRLGLGS